MLDFTTLEQRIIEVSQIKGIHKIAKVNPKMSEEQFEQLTKSIKDIGITVPIILYRGLIVDGRHRVDVCKNTGITKLPAKIIPHKTKINDIEKEIYSMEVRRHQSKTQNTCCAVLEYVKLKDSSTKVSQEVIAKGHKVALTRFSCAYYIYRYRREWFNVLLDGGQLKVKNNFTDRLDVIKALVKEEQSKETNDIEKPEKVGIRESYLNDEYIINGKKEMASNILLEARSKFDMSAKDLADMFYAIANGDEETKDA